MNNNFEEWIEKVRRLMRWVGVATVFVGLCIFAGYFVTKLEKSTIKTTVPDCGSCRIYKDKK